MVNTMEWRVCGALRLLDQRKLPAEVSYLECKTHREVADAISTMVVRGAPAIGIAAAYGMVLAASEVAVEHKQRALLEALREAGERLEASRPTAVNLSWAVRRMLNLAINQLEQGASVADCLRYLEAEAGLIHEEDVIMNQRLGLLGAQLVRPGDTILTHCNAGALATGGYGTALGVIRRAWEESGDIQVFVDETRPRFQGARLTAWELATEGIPATIITDNSAGWLMRQGRVSIVFVGADRIAANGDVANKIGTYTLAVLARENDVPFYVVAPSSTLDLSIASGEQIPIEERDTDEVIRPAGTLVSPVGVRALNYAFDVTPNEHITGIITEAGIAYPPYTSTLR